MPTSRRIGAVTVIALHDATGVFFQTRQEAFPQATAEHWRQADARDAGAERDGEWLLRFRCFALRLDDGRTILIDTGIGAAEAPARRWAPVPGRLPDELAAAGIGPDEVDVVVLTHMHSDHIGWAVDGQAGTPYFGSARYLMQRAEIEAIERLDSELPTWLLEPLRATGQLVAVDGETRLAAGLRVLATPGVTPLATSRSCSTPVAVRCCSPGTCWCTRCSWSTRRCRTPSRATRTWRVHRGWRC
jgi:Metallo-beta-lactamase superfamily